MIIACCEQFTEDTERIMQQNDGLHFSERGYEALAQYIADGLRNILNI